MQKLFKHPLEFERLHAYFKDRLENVNQLSSEVLSQVNFHDGYFFTLLPDDANLDRIYELKEGLVLPQNPELPSISGKSTYQIVPTIDEEMSEYLYQILCFHHSFTCIIDDVMRRPKDRHLEFFKMNQLLFSFKDELYYKIETAKADPETIEKCLKKSNAFWHSLCVLTKASFVDVNDTFTLEKIREISLKIHLIIIAAYDGEGYVLWEKQDLITQS